ncbi:adenylate cyclase [Bdellovibrio sp. qaytius]|nr:adenylate cyclase [Bdellovibrio sp. qaytius]
MLQLQDYTFLLALQVVTGVIFLGCYYGSRFRKLSHILYWPFILVIATFIFLISLKTAGFQGSAHYYLFPALVMAIALSSSNRRTFLAFILFLAMALGLALISFRYPDWISSYATSQEQLLDVSGNVLFVQLFIGAVVLILMKNLNLERRKSDQLLKNILPDSIASELKKFNRVEPREYQVTILFTDFIGFTKLSEQLSPQQLVTVLDTHFTYFDQVCRKYNLEKIKTIGDAYMAVAGLPISNSTHPQDCVSAALEIRDYMRAQNTGWKIRLGINTGTVIAGVIGREKFSYDVWGDDVNVASRIESSGVENEVNISQQTYDKVKHLYACESRGLVAAKNKDDIPMYLVRAPNLAKQIL